MPRKACVAVHEGKSATVGCLWEVNQEKVLTERACDPIHEGCLFQCNVCVMHFRRR